MTIANEVRNEVYKNMTEELTDRHYDWSKNAINSILDTWNERKDALLDLLSKHPLWNSERLMIQFDADYERPICTQEINDFCRFLRQNVPNAEWSWWGEQTKENKIVNFINNITSEFFNEGMSVSIEEINALDEKFRLRTNMKSSKAIGKLCRDMGWDQIEGYNKRYSALCDCLNPIKVTRHTCISLNPVDFLLMSNGTSWNSCHDIGEADDCGCYSSGTISYMLDEHSFVFYTVHSEYDGDCIEREPKVQRQIFGYNDEVLFQSRLYPQSNDCGADHVYTEIRNIVQKVIADCLGKSNLWVKSSCGDVVHHGFGATCYPDFKHFSMCNISTLKERENGKEGRRIVMGAKPICIECGSTHGNEENINCCCSGGYYCADCGCWIDEDDAYYYNGDYYCSDCVSYCEECCEYVPNDEIREIDGVWVCEDCIQNSENIYACEHCGTPHFTDNMVFTYDGDAYCESCAERYIVYCEECDEYYHIDDTTYDPETNQRYCDDCYHDILANREREAEEERDMLDIDDEDEIEIDDEFLLEEELILA